VTRKASAVVVWRDAIRESDLRSSARLVALVLSTHMDRNGGSCFPSLSTIARETALGRSTVKRALDALQEAGFIERVSGGPTTPNRYRAGRPGVNLPLGSLERRGRPTVGHEDVQEDVHNPSPRADARRKGRERAPKKARSDPDPWKDVERYDR
jgi:DNA-binding transcriptional MocR family regulator